MGALIKTGATAAAVMLVASMASATTFTFDSNPQDGFDVSPFTTDASANCPTAGDRCLSLNTGAGAATLTHGAGPFDVSGFDFNLARGNDANTLKVVASYADGTIWSQFFNAASGFMRNATYSIPLTLTGLRSLRFSHFGGGTAKVDNIKATPNVVPLPMTALLLGTAFAGLGGLGAVRRRRGASAGAV